MTDLDSSFPLLIVGAGRMGTAWIQALSAAPKTNNQCHVSGVFDPDPAASAAALPLENLLVSPTLAEALAGTNPSGAIICTPPDTHVDLARILLDKGIPVLCEKPLCPTLAGLNEMLSAAKDKALPICLASKFRFVEDLQRAAELLQSEVIGEPISAAIEFAGSFPVAGSWHADPTRSGGGVIADNGPHAADVARMLLGPITEASAFELPRIQTTPVEDSAWLALRHENRTLTTVSLSWSLPPTSPWYVTIQGSAGTMLIGWQESKYRVKDAPDWVPFGDGYKKNDALVNMAGAFVDYLRGVDPYPIAEKSMLASVAVITAARKSMENSGKAITISGEHR